MSLLTVQQPGNKQEKWLDQFHQVRALLYKVSWKDRSVTELKQMVRIPMMVDRAVVEGWWLWF